MEFVLVALVLAAVFGFIAYPILNPPRTEKNGTDALDTLIVQRDSAYQAIRDLDFDYELGKLSTNDYSVLRERFKSRAASTLKEIDEMQASQTDQAAPTLEQDLRCGNCGTPHELSDKFCRKCGNRLD
jgi:zinc ribbon protein